MRNPMGLRAKLTFGGLIFVGLAGCASLPDHPRDAFGNPMLERLSQQELPRSAPRVSLDEVVAMSRSGRSAEEITLRLQQSGSRFNLSEAERKSLRERGVEERVIAFIDSYEREAKRTDAITAQVDREAQARQRREAIERSSPYPYYGYPYGVPYPHGYWGPRVYPYGGYGWSRWGSRWYGGVGIGF